MSVCTLTHTKVQCMMYLCDAPILSSSSKRGECDIIGCSRSYSIMGCLAAHTGISFREHPSAFHLTATSDLTACSL